MASFNEARLFSQDVYGQNLSLQLSSELGWSRASVDNAQYTTYTNNGFGAGLYLKQAVDGDGHLVFDSNQRPVYSDVVIAYRGTEFPSDLHDLTTDTQIALGTPVATNAQFAEAEDFYKNVVNNVLPGLGIDSTQVNLSFTGHSLGSNSIIQNA